MYNECKIDKRFRYAEIENLMLNKITCKNGKKT